MKPDCFEFDLCVCRESSSRALGNQIVDAGRSARATLRNAGRSTDKAINNFGNNVKRSISRAVSNVKSSYNAYVQQQKAAVRQYKTNVVKNAFPGYDVTYDGDKVGIVYNGRFVEITSQSQAEVVRACMNQLEKEKKEQELEKARAEVETNKTIIGNIAEQTLALSTGGTDYTYGLSTSKDSVTAGGWAASIKHSESISKAEEISRDGNNDDDFWKAGTSTMTNTNQKGEVVTTNSAYIGIGKLKIEVSASSNWAVGLQFGWTTDEGVTNYAGLSLGVENLSAYKGTKFTNEKNETINIKDSANVNTLLVAEAALVVVTAGAAAPVVGSLTATQAATAGGVILTGAIMS